MHSKGTPRTASLTICIAKDVRGGTTQEVETRRDDGRIPTGHALLATGNACGWCETFLYHWALRQERW